MQNIEVRQMTYADIPAICKADRDESESFVNYLKRQLEFQDNNECSALLARRVNTKVYLDACLNAEYGPAQRFYALRGYVPDGAGVYYEEHVLGKDEACKNDDELTLCLVKELG
ncbi:MAG: hypothetical protein J6Y10_11480 [Lachnospiraceae bacterium]|nr:hypothetical protein [Lachnospiraceae bacterium]